MCHVAKKCFIHMILEQLVNTEEHECCSDFIYFILMMTHHRCVTWPLFDPQVTEWTFDPFWHHFSSHPAEPCCSQRPPSGIRDSERADVITLLVVLLIYSQNQKTFRRLPDLHRLAWDGREELLVTCLYVSQIEVKVHTDESVLFS